MSARLPISESGLQASATASAPRCRAPPQRPARRAYRRWRQCRPHIVRARGPAAARRPPLVGIVLRAFDRGRQRRRPAGDEAAHRFGRRLEVGGHSAASSAPSRPGVPAPIYISRPPCAIAPPVVHDGRPDLRDCRATAPATAASAWFISAGFRPLVGGPARSSAVAALGQGR